MSGGSVSQPSSRVQAILSIKGKGKYYADCFGRPASVCRYYMYMWFLFVFTIFHSIIRLLVNHSAAAQMTANQGRAPSSIPRALAPPSPYYTLALLSNINAQ